MGSYFLFFLFLIRFLYDFNQRYLRCLRFRGSFLFSFFFDRYSSAPNSFSSTLFRLRSYRISANVKTILNLRRLSVN